MKIVINKIGGVTTLPDGTLSIGYASSKEMHTLEIKPEALQQLFLPLLASKRDDLTSSLSRKIHAGGIGRFRMGDDIGISFLVTPEIAVHMVLQRPLAEVLQKLIQTFDDPSTWQIVGPPSR